MVTSLISNNKLKAGTPSLSLSYFFCFPTAARVSFLELLQHRIDLLEGGVGVGVQFGARDHHLKNAIIFMRRTRELPPKNVTKAYIPKSTFS